MESIKWLGSKGQSIELRAECNTELRPRIINLDGDVFEGDLETHTIANLELWVDDKKVDSSRDINFWKLIDCGMVGYKKVWGLKVAMPNDQAELVDQFLQSVIEASNTPEVVTHEAAKKAEEKAAEIKTAEAIIAASANTIKNADGSLMTRKQAIAWQTNYNNINNEGGDGYVPNIITIEDVTSAQQILKAAFVSNEN